MALNFPDAPADGQIFQNWTWSAATGAWLPSSTVGSGIIVSDTPPASPTAGALWWESDTGTMYVYYNDGNSSQWVQVLAGAPPKTGAFMADRNNVDQTGMTAGNYTKASFTNASINSDGWFNTTTGRYTPQVAGVYSMTFTAASAVGLVTGSIYESCQPAIHKNGSAVGNRLKNGTYIQATSMQSAIVMICQTFVAMNGSTDYLEPYLYLPTGVTTMQGATLNTQFNGFRVGA